MNFSQHLLEFLKKQGNASVLNFGTFSLQNTSATLDESGNNILPPGKKIAFSAKSLDKSSDFIEYLSTQEKITLLEAEIEIRKQVTFWNSKLEKEGFLKIENFGSFHLNDSQLHFTGDKTESVTADFYGLEEINLSEIKRGNSNNKEKNYRFPKIIFWATPLIIGLSTIAYFAITQPEQIFGKASFLKNFGEKPKVNIQKPVFKKDSTAIILPNTDSIRLDSVKNATPKKIAPSQKWSSKK